MDNEKENSDGEHRNSGEAFYSRPVTPPSSSGQPAGPQASGAPASGNPSGSGPYTPGARPSLTVVATLDDRKHTVENGGIKSGEIVGYRVWRFSDLRLRSYFIDYEWEPRAIHEARKNDVNDGYGFFAFKDKTQCLIEFNGWNVYGNTVVYGEIEMWGDVIEHERGYRAQFAAVKSIHFISIPGSRYGQWQFYVDFGGIIKQSENGVIGKYPYFLDFNGQVVNDIRAIYGVGAYDE